MLYLLWNLTYFIPQSPRLSSFCTLLSTIFSWPLSFESWRGRDCCHSPCTNSRFLPIVASRPKVWLGSFCGSTVASCRASLTHWVLEWSSWGGGRRVWAFSRRTLRLTGSNVLPSYGQRNDHRWSQGQHLSRSGRPSRSPEPCWRPPMFRPLRCHPGPFWLPIDRASSRDQRLRLSPFPSKTWFFRQWLGTSHRAPLPHLWLSYSSSVNCAYHQSPWVWRLLWSDKTEFWLSWRTRRWHVGPSTRVTISTSFCVRYTSHSRN